MLNPKTAGRTSSIPEAGSSSAPANGPFSILMDDLTPEREAGWNGPVVIRGLEGVPRGETRGWGRADAGSRTLRISPDSEATEKDLAVKHPGAGSAESGWPRQAAQTGSMTRASTTTATALKAQMREARASRRRNLRRALEGRLRVRGLSGGSDACAGAQAGAAASAGDMALSCRVLNFSEAGVALFVPDDPRARELVREDARADLEIAVTLPGFADRRRLRIIHVRPASTSGQLRVGCAFENEPRGDGDAESQNPAVDRAEAESVQELK